MIRCLSGRQKVIFYISCVRSTANENLKSGGTCGQAGKKWRHCNNAIIKPFTSNHEVSKKKDICPGVTHHSTAQIAVMKLCTKDVEMFLHFHPFLQADSGMGRVRTPALTNLKKPTELPVVRTTALSSMLPKDLIFTKTTTAALHRAC